MEGVLLQQSGLADGAALLRQHERAEPCTVSSTALGTDQTCVATGNPSVVRTLRAALGMDKLAD
jgi:hypothetical protein